MFIGSVASQFCRILNYIRNRKVEVCAGKCHIYLSRLNDYGLPIEPLDLFGLDVYWWYHCTSVIHNIILIRSGEDRYVLYQAKCFLKMSNVFVCC